MSSDLQDERLRRLFLEGSELLGIGACPSPEKLWQAASGELSPELLAELVEHCAQCAACAEDLAITRSMVAEAESAGRGVSRSRAPNVVPFGRLRSGSPWVKGLAMAAALALMVLSWRFIQPETEGPVYRKSETTPVTSLVTDGAELPFEKALLKWSGPEGAVYDLLVTTETLTVLLEAQGLAETEYLIPVDRLIGLEDGTVLIWQLDAVLKDGSRAQSQAYKVKLVRKVDEG